MPMLRAKANPPSPAAQAIAPFCKGGLAHRLLLTQSRGEHRHRGPHFAPFGQGDDTAHNQAPAEFALFEFAPFEFAPFEFAPFEFVAFEFVAFECVAFECAAIECAPFEKGGRHRAAMTGGFASAAEARA